MPSGSGDRSRRCRRPSSPSRDRPGSRSRPPSSCRSSSASSRRRRSRTSAGAGCRGCRRTSKQASAWPSRPTPSWRRSWPRWRQRCLTALLLQTIAVAPAAPEPAAPPVSPAAPVEPPPPTLPWPPEPPPPTLPWPPPPVAAPAAPARRRAAPVMVPAVLPAPAVPLVARGARRAAGRARRIAGRARRAGPAGRGRDRTPGAARAGDEARDDQTRHCNQCAFHGNHLLEFRHKCIGSDAHFAYPHPPQSGHVNTASAPAPAKSTLRNSGCFHASIMPERVDLAKPQVSGRLRCRARPPLRLLVLVHHPRPGGLWAHRRRAAQAAPDGGHGGLRRGRRGAQHERRDVVDAAPRRRLGAARRTSSASRAAWRGRSSRAARARSTPPTRPSSTSATPGWERNGKQFEGSAANGPPGRYALKDLGAGPRRRAQQMVEGDKRVIWVPGALAYAQPPELRERASGRHDLRGRARGRHAVPTRATRPQDAAQGGEDHEVGPDVPRAQEGHRQGPPERRDARRCLLRRVDARRKDVPDFPRGP